MSKVGYARLRDQLGLGTLPVTRPAVVRPVTRIQAMQAEISIPSGVAPGDGVIEQLLFALKHEGTDLAQLAAICPHVPGADLLTALRAQPTGGYLRKLCYLWERFTGQQLEDLPPEVGGTVYPLFDPEKYLTAPGPRDQRWRIDFNGLGDFDHCPTVRLTPEIQQCLASDPLGEAMAYLKSFAPQQLERVLGWAYLSETRSSYALEGEAPGGNKAEAFASLLRHAHAPHDLTEEHLTALQNVVVPNAFSHEATFRTKQNYLTNSVPGAAGVTYVPPPQEEVLSLMESIDRLANGKLCPDLSPLVRATLVSFGFVFVHPFLDGNGRLSRFLSHYTLCQSKALPNGHILPLSIAMKRNEVEYLAALTSFSKPARELWNVLWLDGDEFQFEFRGHPAIYRYWDATESVLFMYHMAEETLRNDLQGEVQFLLAYDATMRAVNERFDVPGSTLSMLIRMAWSSGSTLSLNRRKQFEGMVQPELFDFIEATLREHRR
ncbi:MAG: Fic family protein [Steroidobacteraceae bacterium]